MEMDVFTVLGFVRPIPDHLKAHLQSILKHETIPKDGYILKAGQISKRICFVKRGLLWAYFLKDGNPVAAWFMKEGSFVVSITSFYHQEISKEFIQASEETEILYVTFEELENAYVTYPDFCYIGLKFTQEYLVEWDQRLHALLATSAKERLAWLEENKPELLQRVPSKLLASYVGMSAVHYSKTKSYKRKSNSNKGMRKAS
jgi:CRP-like cAMP-binding protein